ncbi:MAG: LPS assembly protein LptD, partial [Nitrospirota bacterium]|nr:LPS assembly protein LptD [Nitrospirota bacterium]
MHRLSGEMPLIFTTTRYLHPFFLCLVTMALVCTVAESTKAAPSSDLPLSGSAPDGSTASLDITAEQVEFDRTTETFVAVGSVVITQGKMRLTADRARLHKLSGRLKANGRVHLQDPVTDIWAEELAINVNTESGVITQGTILLHESNTWVRGRLLQRFSETHFRAKDGSFTNCDAADGQIPDWSFAFEDVDIEQGDSIYAKNVWLQIKNHSILPLPALRYPMPGGRKTGFLIPTVGIDNVLGVQYRQGFFWAFTPSQDLLVTPYIFSKRGQGGDVGYRYVLGQRSQGKWLVSTLNDTDKDRVRAQVTGAHVQQVTDTLALQMKVNFASDRSLLQDLSSSGVFRALPSQESNLTVTQLLPGGSVYLKAQYLQPLDTGGQTTFQRLPEVGLHVEQPFLFGLPISVGMDSNFVHFFRDEGFDVSRVDLMPSIAAQGLHVGHVIGLRPQVKLREVIYSHGRGATQTTGRDRGTFWLGFEASSSLSRRFSLGDGRLLRHTLKPSVMYEYVPQTRQADLVQVDAIDNLPGK